MPEVLFLLEVRQVLTDLAVTTLTLDPSSENKNEINEITAFSIPGGLRL